MSSNNNDNYVVRREWVNYYRQRSSFELPSNNYSPYPMAAFSEHPLATGSPHSTGLILASQAKDKTVVETSTEADREKTNKAVQIFKRLSVEEQEREIGILSTLLGQDPINRLPGESDNDYRVRCFLKLYRSLPLDSEYPEAFLFTYQQVHDALWPPPPPPPPRPREEYGYAPIWLASKISTFDMVEYSPEVSSIGAGNGNGKKPRFSLKFW